MKFELNKMAEDAKREYWENAYKNKLKDIYHLEVAEKWLESAEGIQTVGLDKATNGRLNAKKNLAELKIELSFLEGLMVK